MFLHNFLYQCQSYPGIGIIVFCLQCLKHHKYPVMILRCDAGAVVLYRELIEIAFFGHLNPDMPPFATVVFDTVADKVGEYLGQLQPVGFQSGHTCGYINTEFFGG